MLLITNSCHYSNYYPFDVLNLTLSDLLTWIHLILWYSPLTNEKTTFLKIYYAVESVINLIITSVFYSFIHSAERGRQTRLVHSSMLTMAGRQALIPGLPCGQQGLSHLKFITCYRPQYISRNLQAGGEPGLKPSYSDLRLSCLD